MGFRFGARVLLIVIAIGIRAQAQPTPVPSEPKPDIPTDPLGRSTPRGTVLRFLDTARRGDWEAAVQYLNGPLPGRSGHELARQLFVVLDRRLPARLNEISDRPEGDLPFPSRPNEDLIGRVEGDRSNLDVIVERRESSRNGPIWLFSRATLEGIPEIYAHLDEVTVDDVLPSFLVETQFLKIPLFEWLAVFIGLPTLYLLGSASNRILKLLIGRIRPLKTLLGQVRNPLPPAVRLLIIAGIIRWVLYKVRLPLLARQFWSSIAFLLVLSGCVWLLILVCARIEARWRSRLLRIGRPGAISFLRFARRTVEVLLILGGFLVCLYHFGLSPTAAIAGVGVGGIAVALAAQKTLENVIAGMSLIFDRSVQVGDALKVSDTFGTVEDIGLRSTRIRTLDRTLVSVPNGQLATFTLENITRRDKFWMRQLVNLRLETTSSEMRCVCSGLRKLLLDNPFVEPGSVSVNILSIGRSAFELEIFAYVLARNWQHFLELRGNLLLEVMETIERSGTAIALPSQMMYIEPQANITGAEHPKLTAK